MKISNVSYNYNFIPNHLGSGTLITDIRGNPYQFFLNLPFGETFVDRHTSTGNYENVYKFNGKELDTETGLYYYGARYYNPRLSQFYATDPLAEKYPGINPYVYTIDNPINYIDPTGLASYTWDTDYKLDKKTGKVSRINETDGSEKNSYDRLYATDDNGNLTENYTQINKTNPSDDSIISDLSYVDSENVSFSTGNTNANSIYKLFRFNSDYSNVEWIAGRTKLNTYFIGTSHNSDFLPSFSDMMISDKNVIAFLHSHPDIQYSGYKNNFDAEKASMGYYWRPYTDLDWGQVRYEVQKNNYRYKNYRYVYVPKSGRLWRVGYHNPIYIRNINRNYKRFFFGTLNK